MPLRIRPFTAAVLFSLALGSSMRGQDSVDVTFRYTPPTAQTSAFLTGEFNAWSNSAWPMTSVGNNTFIRTVRLSTGGATPAMFTGSPYIPGAFEYKFYYPGASNWPNDPLNPRVDPSHTDNSVLFVKNPTIYHLATTDQIAGNSLTALVRTNMPVISAYLFPAVGSALDTAALSIRIDTALYTGIGAFYDGTARLFQFAVPGSLANGTHVAHLSVGAVADSVTFTVQAGFVQILTHGGFSTWYAQRTVLGLVQDTSIHAVKIVRNSTDTVVAPVSAGNFSCPVPLLEGANVIRAVVDSPSLHVSDPITISRLVNHAPTAAVAIASGAGNTVNLSATASTDPDSQALTFSWRDDVRSPLGIGGKTDTAVSVTIPSAPGEYYFGLVARDPDGHADSTTAYFVVNADGTLGIPTEASNPEWVKRARIYFLFPKAASATGNLAGSAALLPFIRSMGFSVVWLMPVMKNASPIDQGYGVGYNIVDFYNVAPEYGTDTDFRNFMSQAHALGLRVILDITPNHTSRSHPFSVDAHTYHQWSPYWSWYQHATDASDTRGLGWGTDPDGFVYYGGFGDQLLNYNWSDLDARAEMINVYKYWVQQYGVDGYRFDVYWGPHNRYGEAAMGIPVRHALKHIKPDIMLLGETDGTGAGSENNYADYGRGGADLAYDWKLYGGPVKYFNFSSSGITDLDGDVSNGGYWPGPNARFLRFMENQDEDVIFYNNPTPTAYYDADPTTAFRKSMPMASVIFTAPGVPQLWNGQEVGWGYGIGGAKENRNRSTINWSFSGGMLLKPHYQKLATIRGAFPAFATQTYRRIASNSSLVYAFTRPYAGEDAVVAVNFGPGAVSTTLTASAADLGTAYVEGKTLTASDVYADSTSTVQMIGSQISIPVTLTGYGTTVIILADSARHLVYPPLTDVADAPSPAMPTDLELHQNYPNPFNPSTTIEYALPHAGAVRLTVFSVLGEEIVRLVDDVQQAGAHRAVWNGRTLHGIPASSGVYFVRLDQGGAMRTMRMILLK